MQVAFDRLSEGVEGESFEVDFPGVDDGDFGYLFAWDGGGQIRGAADEVGVGGEVGDVL